MYSLVSTSDLSSQQIRGLLATAQEYSDHGYPRKLKGTVATVFTEPSTRTKLSFHQAAYLLGLHVLDFSPQTSSLSKGESLLDTLQTIEAIGAQLAIIRTSEDWPALKLEQSLTMGLINGGSGCCEHPTQALLDALTIQQHYGSVQGVTVTIVGDIAHSRVARSNVDVLTKLGAQVQLSGPEEFYCPELAKTTKWVDFAQAVSTSDVLMMLRIQYERHESQFNMSSDAYLHHHGLTIERLRRMKPDSIVLHPGPVNRNVEIAEQVLAHPKCKILQQVKNGVALRTAILEYCLQGGRHEQLVSA